MWSTKENYYSGQGVVLVGRRGADGKPTGLRPIGNVPDLKIAIATSVLEHKESTTGARGTDLRLTTETKCNLNFTLENFKAKNLADALRGAFTAVTGANVLNYPVKFYAGMVVPLGRIKVSSVVVEQGATALAAYVDELTPWDYRVNPDAGSIMFNDGSSVAMDKAGETVTAITAGATTELSISNSEAVVGSSLVVRGLTGADAAEYNGKAFNVVSKTSSAVVIDAVSTGKTLTTAAGTKATFDGMSLTVDYTYADQTQVDALTEGASELYMRFEGLNTADENSPVVVEVFRFLTDPLKELALISDAVQQFVLEGSVLADTTRPSGSKYFVVSKLD